MQADGLTPQSRTRSGIVLAFVAVLVVAAGFLLRERSIRRQRQTWVNSVQTLGLQTYPLSPLFDPEPGLDGIIESLMTDGQPGVVVSDENDVRRLIDHEGHCPRGTALVVSPRITSVQAARLAERYPTARITSFRELYASASSAGTPLTSK